VADEFYSFDEALQELKLKEEELKRLVSEGEIRAFRKGDTMKLRKADVDNLRAELDSDVVDLGEATEELVFEDDTELDSATGMATQEITDVDTLIDDDIEDVGELELEDTAAVAKAAAIRKRSAAAAALEEEVEEPGWVKGLMIVTTVALILATPIIVSIGTGNASDVAKGIAGVFGQKFDQAPAEVPAE
jgi:excisionase family DNA binding protein